MSLIGSPWAILVLAGLLEVVWALGLKYSNGFSRVGPSVVTVIAAALSFWLLAQAMKDLPVGTAYAVWVGIGAAGTAILGVFLFSDTVSLARVSGVVLILAGVLALRLAEGTT